MPGDDEPVSRDAYDELAPDYDVITDAANREHHEWPAVSSLLPDVDGARVLDAACGNGFYTERIVNAGATAVGVDASPEMAQRAKDRFADDDRVTIHEADLTDGLPFLDDGTFDLVVCQLALDHIRNWDDVFDAFARVVDPGGHVVISTSNPVQDYVDAAFGLREHVHADEATYPEVERVTHDWGGEEEFLMPFYRRPLEAVFTPAIDAGLLVERVLEPDVTEAFAAADPERAARFAEEPPMFLCLRFLKPD